MQRTTMILLALIAVLSGVLLTIYFRPAPARTDEGAVRAIVAQMLDERMAQGPQAPAQEKPAQRAAVSPAMINPMIEKYLMSNPKILQRVSDALKVKLRLQQQEKARLSLASFKSQIYDDPGNIILGNPNGDVTLVEFFDYNCGFCRASMPDVAALIAKDDNLRVIMKEFPILSRGSLEAARISVAVSKTPGADYWAFHEILFTMRGQIDAKAAYAAAEKIGLNRADLSTKAKGKDVAAFIQRSYDLAKGLSITGTPSFIIGDQIMAGAVGYDALKQRVDNMRKCDSASCAT